MTARETFPAKTVSDYVQLFEARGPLHQTPMRWYRGEGRVRRRGSLVPSIARTPSRPGDEWAIYQKFRQNAAAFLPHASLEEWDWMLYMRHYGVHTRLLDWSESALTALFFAVEKPKHDKRDGVVWCLDPLRLNERAGYDRAIQCAGIDKELEVYTPTSLKDSAAGADFKPVALIAPRSFPRLIAQQGVFTVTHRQQLALDAIDDATLLATVRIPAASKRPIRDTLQSLGMSRLSLYPELQSLAGESP